MIRGAIPIPDAACMIHGDKTKAGSNLQVGPGYSTAKAQRTALVGWEPTTCTTAPSGMVV